VLARAGWLAEKGEADAIANLRADLIAALSAVGDPAVIAEARRRHAAQSENPAEVPAELRKTILGVVARHAGEADWDRLRAAANKEKVDLVRDQLFGLLASTEDPALAQRALDMALTAEPGRTNSAEMIARVSALHPDLAFDFALKHHAEVDARVDTTSRTRYFARLTFRSLDRSIIDKLDSYAVKHLPAESRREVDTAIAGAKYRIRIIEKWLPAVDEWLQQQGS
jgi:aminopeptidase N